MAVRTGRGRACARRNRVNRDRSSRDRSSRDRSSRVKGQGHRAGATADKRLDVSPGQEHHLRRIDEPVGGGRVLDALGSPCGCRGDLSVFTFDLAVTDLTIELVQLELSLDQHRLQEGQNEQRAEHQGDHHRACRPGTQPARLAHDPQTGTRCRCRCRCGLGRRRAQGLGIAGGSHQEASSLVAARSRALSARGLRASSVWLGRRAPRHANRSWRRAPQLQPSWGGQVQPPVS